MQRCATCGTTADLRLYFLQRGTRVERHWLCPDCLFAARRVGVNASAAPVWIERAALNRLPMKPLEADYLGHNSPTIDRRRAWRSLAGRRADRSDTRDRA